MLSKGFVTTGLSCAVHWIAIHGITIRWITVRWIAVALAFGLSASVVSAQSDFPRRPITVIVPFAAGGPTDVIARIASEHMSRTLGQQLIIENVLGAGGTTASTRAMRSNPDGYTIIMGHM